MIENTGMMKRLCTQFARHASQWAIWATLLFMAGQLPVHAMSWFRPGQTLSEYPLSNNETARLNRQAGWPADDPTSWMITLRNPLPGAITCREVQFFPKTSDAQVRVRMLQPPLYVPAGQSRSSLLADVRKSDIRDWAMQCHCLRSSPQGPCENPP